VKEDQVRFGGRIDDDRVFVLRIQGKSTQTSGPDLSVVVSQINPCNPPDTAAVIVPSVGEEVEIGDAVGQPVIDIGRGWHVVRRQNLEVVLPPVYLRSGATEEDLFSASSAGMISRCYPALKSFLVIVVQMVFPDVVGLRADLKDPGIGV